MTKQNKVAGPTLEYNEIVPTETVTSPNRKDRRRENDDSKHDEKVRRELEKRNKQRASVEVNRDNPMQNPYNHHDKLDNVSGYTPTSIKNVKEMPMANPISSTPYEKLSNLHLHLNPEKHD